MNTQIVSVVMPVYNAAPFLREAINSVLQQSFLDFELILINDGSTDESEQIIKSFTDERISYHYQKNQGVAATLNKGVALAKGKYIWRHDADDISLPSKLKEQLGFLEQYPEFDLCAVQVAFLTESGKPAWKFRQPKNRYFGNSSFVEVKRAHFNPYSPITHGTVLMKAEAVRNVGGYRAEFITGEDVDLWLRFIQQYKAAVLNDCLSLHRLSSYSATKVHGWKNEFFRNLAFKFYNQREQEGVDDLQLQIPITLPEKEIEITPISIPPEGKCFRGDLLEFLYPLYFNAKDFKETKQILKVAIRDGWKLKKTWKLILFPLLGEKGIRLGVTLKKALK